MKILGPLSDVAQTAVALFAANSDAEPTPDLSAEWSDVREGLAIEARGRKLLAESEELVFEGALRVGRALIEIKKKTPSGLWLEGLAALRIKQSTAWYYMQFADEKWSDDDRTAYLWRNGFSLRKAVDEYRVRAGVSRKKTLPATQTVPDDSVPPAYDPLSPRDLDERRAEIARRVAFAFEMIDSCEAQLAAEPDPEPALGEIADGLRSLIRQYFASELAEKLLPSAADSS